MAGRPRFVPTVVPIGPPDDFSPAPLTSQAIPMSPNDEAKRRSVTRMAKGNSPELYTVLKMCPPALGAMANRVPSSVFG